MKSCLFLWTKIIHRKNYEIIVKNFFLCYTGAIRIMPNIGSRSVGFMKKKVIFAIVICTIVAILGGYYNNHKQ